MTAISLPPSPMTAFPVTMGTLAFPACSDLQILMTSPGVQLLDSECKV